MTWPILRRPPPARPGEVNYPFVDRFTFVHFSIGVLYGYLELGIGWAALLAIGWELVEDRLKVWVPRLFPHATADTWRNSLGDVIAVLSGWRLMLLALSGA